MKRVLRCALERVVPIAGFILANPSQCSLESHSTSFLNEFGAVSPHSHRLDASKPQDVTPSELFRLSRPRIMHKVLEDPNISPHRKGILIIGDVHGCYEELILLHEKAVEINGGFDFQYTILVGDLCNKGPSSAKVIQHVRTKEFWLTVRGNHDDGALRAATGDEPQKQKAKYQWIENPGNDDIPLSKDDIEWLSELPYTIRIPGSFLDEEFDTLVVHAGLVPGVDLENQSISTMVTLRDIEKVDASGEFCSPTDNKPTSKRIPWAPNWPGPERIVFGHDAKRGLQMQQDLTIGLDSGAVYGKKLSGIILPSRQLVQVDSLKVYEPIRSKV